MHILCPHCRNPIEVVKLTPREELSCPSCGSSFCLETGSTTGWESVAGRKFGKFELLDTVGHGAFGTVHKARDSELDRTVAIKVPRAGNLAGPDELDRFLREARSAAQLRHPSIVTVHEVGAQDGVPYLVSDFVRGVTLAELLSARRPSYHEAAELVAAVADALQYAHERGVVHRDVKPSNVMIGDDGRPCVMDFGLAKRDAGEITMTVEGQVLGTPAYMSPEQARGEAHRVDGRSDVYSLGVMLYQMLTGELPFRGTSRMLLHQVLHDDPRPPRRLNDRIPRDLETITLKAMAKESARRYATAKELADDLRRYLRGEAVTARPTGPTERLLRWGRRNPRLAAAACLAVVGLLTTAGVSAWFAAYQSVAAAELARVNGDLATSNQDKDRINNDLEGEKKKVEESLGHVRKLSEERREQLIRAARREFSRGLELCQDGKTSQGMLWLASALGTAPADADDLQRSLRANLAAWRAETCTLRDVRPNRFLSGRVVSPDGKYEWRRVGSAEQFWDVAADRPVGRPMPANDFPADHFYPSRKYVGGGNRMKVRHLGAFSPDGTLLLQVYGDGTSQLWEAPSGLPRGDRQPDECQDMSPRFSPDSRVVARITASQVTFWNTATGREIGEPVREGRFRFLRDPADPYTGARQLAFSPDGRFAAVLALSVHLLDLRTGKWVAAPSRHSGDKLATEAVFSPDGETLLTRADEVCLWESATGRPRCDPLPHSGGVHAVAFSPDGRVLATGGKDGTVRFWEPATGKPLGDPLGHPGIILWMQFTRDSGTLVTACSPSPAGSGAGNANYDYSEARSWDVAARTARHHHPVALPPGTRQVWLSPDGAFLLASGWKTSGAVRVWEVGTGRPYGSAAPAGEDANGISDALDFSPRAGGTSFWFEPLFDSGRLWEVGNTGRVGLTISVPGLFSLDFSPDGRHLLTTERSRNKRYQSGCSLRRWPLGAVPPAGQMVLDAGDGFTGLQLSDDGRTVLATRSRNTIQVWEAETGLPCGVPLPEELGLGLCAARLSPDGRWLWVDRNRSESYLWNVAAGKEVLRLPAGDDDHGFCGFSADGGRVAVLTTRMDRARSTSEVRVVDAAEGKVVARLAGIDYLSTVALSPDGKTVATSTFATGAPVQLWDVGTGKPIGAPLPQPHHAQGMAFSPDGRTLLTCCENKDPSGWQIRCWDAVTRKLAIGPIELSTSARFPVPFLAFLPDGRTFLTAVATGQKDAPYSLRYWDAATGKETDPPAEWKGFTVTGWEGHDDGWPPVTGCLVGRVAGREKWLLPSTGKLVEPPHADMPEPSGKWSATYSDDGKRFVSTTKLTTVDLRDTLTGKALGPALPWKGRGVRRGWSADGRLVIMTGEDGRPRVWDVTKGEPLCGPLGPVDRPLDQFAAFSPDGKLVLTCGAAASAGGREPTRCQLWEVATGRELSPLMPAAVGPDSTPLFSPDGGTLLLPRKRVGNTTEYVLWDVADRQTRGEPLRVRFDVAAFDSDGRTLWTAVKGRKVRAWDATTGKPLGELAECPAPLRATLRYSPDGALRLDESARLLDASTGNRVGRTLELGFPAGQLFGPDGTSVAAANQVGEVTVLRFPPRLEGSPERVKCWVEVITGMELDADGTGHVLGPDAWKRRKQRLEELGGPPIP